MLREEGEGNRLLRFARNDGGTGSGEQGAGGKGQEIDCFASLAMTGGQGAINRKKRLMSPASAGLPRTSCYVGLQTER